MPRSKEVTLGDKKFVVTERKIKELEALAVSLSGSLDAILKAENTQAAMKGVTAILYEQLPVLFPEITAEDVKEAFISDIESLLSVFIELHFFALKRMLPGLMALVQAGLKSEV